jgi:hypothetical protein
VIHHNPTIKKPRSGTAFSQNPLQKQQNTTKLKRPRQFAMIC